MKAAFTLLQSIVKPFLVAVMIVTCIQSVYAQTTYTWKGTTSSDWNTASNWSPASVPTSTSIVQIGYTTFTNSPTISSTETVSAASISFGTAKTATLTLNGNLTVSGNISMASTTTFSMANTGVLTLGGNFSSGTLKFPSSSTAKIIMNGTAAQYFPNTTLLSGAVGYLDVQNTYYNSSSDEGVKLLNNTSGSVTINYLYVENNAIFNANATLVEGSGYHCTIGQHAIYISRSTFNFHSNDVIDPTSTLEFTAANQVINMVKFNADSTNVPPNVLFTGTNITVNAGTSPNNATVFKVLGTLGVINTTNSVTFDSKLTLIDIGDNFTGNGALSSGSLPIHIGGSWLNTATYNVGGVVTYNGNDADSTQIVATSPNYQKDVVFTGATPKTVSSGTMMVGGNLDNSAGTNLNFTTNSSTLLMDGSGTQYIKGGTATNSTYPNNIVSGTVFNNITVSTTGTSPNVTLQGYNNIGPQGVLTINSPASLNATATNSLTLMSDATGSATFAALPSGSSISGSSINVQRYIQGSSTGLSKRGYRLLSSPVYTGTVTGSVHVFDLNWLLNSSIVTGASGGGFYSVGNPSVYVFREDIIPSNSLFTSGNYKGISAVNNTPSYNLGSQKRLTVTNINDTTINIPVGNGILFFFRGNKTLSNGTTSGTKTSLPFNYPENVTFTNTGTLNTGTVNVKIWYRQDNNLGYTNSPSLSNAAARGYNVIGNPYASTINWEKFNRNSTVANSSIYGSGNLCSTIWLFNPTNKQYEAYMQKTTTISTADTTTNLDPGTAVGSASNMIASGQAFVIQANSATQTLSFRETAKTNTQGSATKLNILMGMPKIASTDEPLIRLQMFLDSLNTDEIVVRLNNNASNAFAQSEDAEDLGGFGAAVGLSAMSGDSLAMSLAIDRRPFPAQSASQIIPLNVAAANSGSYQLKLTQLTSLPGVYQVVLRDNYLQDSVVMHAGTSYAFKIDLTNPATFGKDRFQLVIGQSLQNALQLLSFNGHKTLSGSMLKWKVQNEYNSTTFFVERSTDKGQTFLPIGSVPSNGSGSYNLLDKNPVTGENQYRLKVSDFNGNITYSNVVSINYTVWHNLISNINIYPNPAASVLNLSVNQNFSLSSFKVSSYKIQIVNSFGVVVKKATSNQSTWNTNISDLQPGTYIVQVTNNDNNGLVGTASFIKD